MTCPSCRFAFLASALFVGLATAADPIASDKKAAAVPASCGHEVYGYFSPGSLVVWGLAEREKKITIRFKDAPFGRVLEAIATQSGVRIENKTSIKSVSAQYRREKLEDVLFDLAERYHLVYEVPAADELRIYDTIKPPVIVTKIDPEFPTEAKRAGVAGRVFLATIICTDGTIGSVEVLKSPHPALSAAARAAVSQWKYRPATRDGEPIAVYLTIVVSFTL